MGVLYVFLACGLVYYMGEGVIKSAYLINYTDGSIDRWSGMVQKEACGHAGGFGLAASV